MTIPKWRTSRLASKKSIFFDFSSIVSNWMTLEFMPTYFRFCLHAEMNGISFGAMTRLLYSLMSLKSKWHKWLYFITMVIQCLIFSSDEEDRICYNHCGDLLSVPFEPSKICMIPSTGRIYHPAKEKVGGFGLIADKLSILWTQEKRFLFQNEDDPPTEFIWEDKKVKLTNELQNKINIHCEGTSQWCKVMLIRLC